MGSGVEEIEGGVLGKVVSEDHCKPGAGVEFYLKRSRGFDTVPQIDPDLVLWLGP